MLNVPADCEEGSIALWLEAHLIRLRETRAKTDAGFRKKKKATARKDLRVLILRSILLQVGEVLRKTLHCADAKFQSMWSEE